MVMSAQTNGVEMGPDMLLLPIASGCRAISQIAIGTGNVRVVGHPEVEQMRHSGRSTALS